MITWHSITSTEYNAADVNKKTDDKIFYLTDTQQIYRGTKNFSESVTLYTDLPENPAIKRLYINENTLEGRVWTGEKWIPVIQKIGLLTDNNSVILNDILNNESKNSNSIISGTNNKSRTANSHVEGCNNNSTPLYGFKIISKDVGDSINTIHLDDVTGILEGMTWNVFENVTEDNGETYVAKYRGPILSVDSTNNTVTCNNYESDFTVQTQLDPENPIGYFIVNGGTVGSVEIIDKSGEFSSHVEGKNNISYFNSHTEGVSNKALGYASHAEGYGTQALGERTHTEGYKSIATGHESHSEGNSSKATGDFSHAEGRQTTSNGKQSHAEGLNTQSDGESSHAEGNSTVASGNQSHAEGYNTQATTFSAHAEGRNTKAGGSASHSEGLGTIASSEAQHVQGKYNIEDTSKKYADIVGNGSSDTARSNAYTLDWSGNGWFAGDVEGVKSNITHKLSEKLNKSDFDEFKSKSATNIINGEAENSIKQICSDSAVGNSSIAFGSGTISGTRVLEITAVSANTDSSSSELTVKLSELTEAELAMFDNLASGDKCCIRTSNEYDYIDIASTDKANSKIVVNTIVSDIKDDEYTNYISFIDYPLLGNTYALTPFTYAEGENTSSLARASHSEGRNTKAIGQYGHSEGRDTIAGYASHAEGRNTQALGNMSHSEGTSTKAFGNNSHSEGHYNVADGNSSHAEGDTTQALKKCAHSEGQSTVANGEYSHAEGYRTTVNGDKSHAEGHLTQVNGNNAHGEGFNTIADGQNSHAEGSGTKSQGYSSHAEGDTTVASGGDSHAEGCLTKANGDNSHAEGLGTIADGKHQHTQGKYNIADNNNKYAHIVGNGASSKSRSNAHTIDWDGNAWFSGVVKIGSDEKELATKEYVDSITIPSASLKALEDKIAALEDRIAELENRITFKSALRTETNNE